MKQMLNKFKIKWCLSSYFSDPAELLLTQSGIFAPIRAPPERFDNIDNSDVQPNLEAKYKGRSNELDIVLFNFCLPKSAIS